MNPPVSFVLAYLMLPPIPLEGSVATLSPLVGPSFIVDEDYVPYISSWAVELIMNPLFCTRFGLLFCFPRRPVAMSMFPVEISALLPAWNAFIKGVGLDWRPGLKKLD